MRTTIDCPCGRKDIEGSICPVCGTDLSPVIKLREIAESEGKKKKRNIILFVSLAATAVAAGLCVILMYALPVGTSSAIHPADVETESARPTETAGGSAEIDDESETSVGVNRPAKTIDEAVLEIESIVEQQGIPADILVRAENDEITLSGKVGDEWLKELLVSVAASIAGPEYTVDGSGLAIETAQDNATEIVLEYVIRKGDTLHSISTAFLGDGDLWPLIYNENKDTIRNPNHIYAGQKITITIKE